jgi:hypothetical protein
MDFHDALVLSSAVASRYYSCCTDGNTVPEVMDTTSYSAVSSDTHIVSMHKTAISSTKCNSYDPLEYRSTLHKEKNVAVYLTALEVYLVKVHFSYALQAPYLSIMKGGSAVGKDR